MKLVIILAVVVLSNAAKLDRNYLPPSHAQTSGGSGSFLETPSFSGPSTNQRYNGNAQSASGFGPSSNDFVQSGNVYGQRENNFVQNENNYATNSNGFARNYDDVNFNNYEARPERPRAALERNAAILRQDNQNDGESYAYAYETENGIYAEENGVATNGVEAQGGFSYTGDDGQIYSIRYTAGQNGFVPEGDHLPTPPPVPEEILRALEQNARDEAAGIYDDGSYNDGKYSNDNGYDSNANNAINGNDNRYTAPTFGGNRYNDADSIVINSGRVMPEDSQNRFNSNIAGQERRFPEANKAYLPPSQSQRGFVRTAPNDRGFGSRKQPSYNARTGYQY